MPDALQTPKAAIVGIGQTEFSKNSGRSELQLAAEAVQAAIDDAGLTPSDIDGLVTFTHGHNDELGSDAQRRHPPRCAGRRARRSAAAGPRRPCSTPPPPWRRRGRTPSSSTGRSTSGRAGASANPRPGRLAPG